MRRLASQARDPIPLPQRLRVLCAAKRVKRGGGDAGAVLGQGVSRPRALSCVRPCAPKRPGSARSKGSSEAGEGLVRTEGFSKEPNEAPSLRRAADLTDGAAARRGRVLWEAVVPKAP
jgi:hypothetical protein